MVEGWALYCEQLMEEAGFYPDAESRIFLLVNLLWRAVRIVLDVGLHTRGMTPAEAVDYMVDHLPIERANAGGGGAPLLRVAHLSALLRRGSARAARPARRLPPPGRARGSSPSGSTTSSWPTADFRSPLARWGMDLGE
jgi:hypothetical protein